jgi:hypothetical protein
MPETFLHARKNAHEKIKSAKNFAQQKIAAAHTAI